jgi:membrane associated rhomboid family serine protease
MKKRWKITYNAPVSLTFALLCVVILLLNDFLLGKHLIPAIFTAPGSAKSASPFNWQSPVDYIRLFTHVFGHSDWNHLIGNLSFILLLGPLMEERYGSPAIALMMTVTAFVTGVLNACAIPSSLLGASGIAFMLIVLSSLSTIEKNVIPVSFILVLAIYMTREFLHASKMDNIATFAHIAGGLCGSLFGFMVAPKKRTTSAAKKEKESAPQSPAPSRTASKSDDSTIVGTLHL